MPAFLEDAVAVVAVLVVIVGGEDETRISDSSDGDALGLGGDPAMSVGRPVNDKAQKKVSICYLHGLILTTMFSTAVLIPCY